MVRVENRSIGDCEVTDLSEEDHGLINKGEVDRGHLCGFRGVEPGEGVVWVEVGKSLVVGLVGKMVGPAGGGLC